MAAAMSPQQCQRSSSRDRLEKELTSTPTKSVVTKDSVEEDAASTSAGSSCNENLASAATSPEKGGDDEVFGHDEVCILHPLQDEWCFWLMVHSKNNKDNWENLTQNVHTFGTIEGFWQLHNNIETPSRLGVGDFSFFKQGIAPAWEDEQCKHGGRWVAKIGNISSRDMDELWLTLTLAVLGENLLTGLSGGESICGVVASARLKGRSKLAIWISEREEAKAMLVGRAFYKMLQGFGHTGELVFEDFGNGSKATYSILGDGANGVTSSTSTAAKVLKESSSEVQVGDGEVTGPRAACSSPSSVTPSSVRPPWLARH